MVYYHVSTVDGLNELKPFKGQLFVTDASHVKYWAMWVRHEHNGNNRPIYVYSVVVPDDVDIYIGADGEEVGDYYVTCPLHVTEIKRL